VKIDPEFPPHLTRPWHTLTANAYVSYWAVRRRFRALTLTAHLDPLCSILLRDINRALGAKSMGALRLEFGLPASTLSTAVARLERQGLVYRTETFGDRRGRVVELTHAGRMRAQAVNGGIDRIEEEAELTAGELGRMGFNVMSNILSTAQDEPDFWVYFD
jgi:DNA-binding MarR family transcriptional regulator